jgi:phospholipid transport system transporter-binding protein
MAAVVAPSPAAAAAVELKETSPGKLTARGPFTFATAKRAREMGLAALRATNSRELEIDCGGISSSDSAGMTVLLDWLSVARQSGRSLRFLSLPEQLKALARISDVEELLEKGV